MSNERFGDAQIGKIGQTEDSIHSTSNERIPGRVIKCIGIALKFELKTIFIATNN